MTVIIARIVRNFFPNKIWYFDFLIHMRQLNLSHYQSLIVTKEFINLKSMLITLYQPTNLIYNTRFT